MLHHLGRLRASAPGHLRPSRPIPPRLILDVCATVSLISLALIGTLVTREETHQPAAPRFARAAPQMVAAPSPYTLKWSSARAEPQRGKNRPPVLLGTLNPAGLTLYCADATGPLTVAVLDAGTWMCRPFLGTPRPITMTAACRFLYDPAARAQPAGAAEAADPAGWRCYRDAS